MESVVTAPSELKEVYQLVDPELTEVFTVIRDAIRHPDPFLSEVFEYGFRLGGKRLRPLLVILAGKAAGSLVPNHIRAAAALEMIHTGTLIHDDILDGALVRRHLATLNVQWDPRTAVLAGDYLLTQAIRLTTEIDDSACYRAVALACSRTCEGELLQTALQNQFAMTEDDYYQVIRGKTASLLECSTHLGAHFAADDSQTEEKLALFGQSIGMAFQILDDLLDLTGDTEQMGKTLGTDLLNRKPTLPLILCLKDSTPEKRAALLEILNRSDLSASDLEFIVNSLTDSGAMLKARRRAEQFVADGIEALQSLPSSPARCALETVARFVLTRGC